jgi:hypothetical protein
MKTPWQKRYELAINNRLFGLPPKGYRWLYALLIVLVLLLGLLLEQG